MKLLKSKLELAKRFQNSITMVINDIKDYVELFKRLEKIQLTFKNHNS